MNPIERIVTYPLGDEPGWIGLFLESVPVIIVSTAVDAVEERGIFENLKGLDGIDLAVCAILSTYRGRRN